jgi:uncharacterized protein (TIGR02246 family)
MARADRTGDEIAIADMLGELADAWKRGDAEAYGARFQADATFTNVFGDFHVGREAFDAPHAEIFRSIFKGSTVTLEVRKLRFPRPDVAVLDVVTGLAGVQTRLPNVQPRADGVLRSSLLMVLTKEHGRWEIAAYHKSGGRRCADGRARPSRFALG